MSKLVSLRFADDELIGWAESYAKERGVSRSRLIELALADYRESCRGGVPDVAPEPREVAKPRAKVPASTDPELAAARAEHARNIAARQRLLNDAKERASR